MNSNHIRLGAFVLLLVTGILAVGDLTKVFPFLPAAYAPLVGIVIVAIKEALMAAYTPATNPRTPDNVPPKVLALILCAGLLALGTTGCTTTSSSSPVVQTLENPNNQAKAVQTGLGFTLSLVLAHNPSYASELDSVADSLVAAAAANPAALTNTDILGFLSKTHLASADQDLIVAGVLEGQETYETSFQGLQLPSLGPVYQLFMDAVANAIYTATGKPPVTLPTVQFTVPTAAAPAAASSAPSSN